MHQIELKFSLFQSVFSWRNSNVDIGIQTLTSELSYPNFNLLFGSNFEFELFTFLARSSLSKLQLWFSPTSQYDLAMIFHVIIKRHSPFSMQWLHNANPDINLYFVCLFTVLQLLFDFERIAGLSFMSYIRFETSIYWQIKRLNKVCHIVRNGAHFAIRIETTL